jgi:hypothetical protein
MKGYAMKKVRSLAKGSKRTYYQARVRVSGSQIKFQVETGKLNRDYGITFVADLGYNEVVRNAIQKKENEGLTLGSLYDGSKERYVLCQFRLPHGTNKIRVQMRTERENRSYGLAFDLYQIGLQASLKAHIKKYASEYTTLQWIERGYVWSMPDNKWVKAGTSA